MEDFFRYFGDANLQDEGVCVHKGAMIRKPDTFRDAPFYLVKIRHPSFEIPPPSSTRNGGRHEFHFSLLQVNPLEVELNAAKNVTREVVDEFQTKCREAVERLHETTSASGEAKAHRSDNSPVLQFSNRIGAFHFVHWPRMADV